MPMVSSPCRSVQFPAGVENRVWFDESYEKIILPWHVKPLSAIEPEPHEKVSMLKIPFHQRASSNKEQNNAATINIPMYPMFGKQKGHSMKPNLIRRQASVQTYKQHLLNKLKFRVY